MAPIASLLLAAVLFALPATAAAEDLAGRDLVEALRRGGHVIYFRHAATEWSQDDRVEQDGDWTSCDPARMRQLSAAGRAAAREIGAAMRALGVPVARVLSSEYCRAAETARRLDLGAVETTRDIMNLRAAAFVGGDAAAATRARRVLATPPPGGRNTVVVGHGNLMQAATGDYTGEAGSGVYRPAPDAPRGFVPVARLEAEDWARLAAQYAN